jgi:hypothetical protein
LPVDGDLRVRNAERDADPEQSFVGVGSRRIDGDPALLDPPR